MALPNLSPDTLSTSTLNPLTIFQTLQNNLNAPGAASAYSAALSNRVLVAPQGVRQVEAFSFDFKGDDIVDMENDVADHWLEDNTAVQDHIGVRPTIVVLKGTIAELSASGGLLTTIVNLLTSLESPLQQLPAYLGSYTPGVTNTISKAISQAQNVAVQMQQAMARASQIANLLPGVPSANKQQAAFAQLSAYRNARILVRVFTPFQLFSNMAIINLKAVQNEKTKMASEFIITFKQMNFIGTQIDTASTRSGRNALNAQVQNPNGGTAGTATAITTVQNAFKALN